MVETTYKAHWDVVGGMVEAGEGLAGAARREALEETGIALAVGDLLVVDTCRASGTRGEVTCALLDGGEHEESFVDSFSYPDGELAAAHWIEPSAVLERCGPRVGTRLSAALQAFGSGRLPGPPLLLLDGSPDT